MKATAPVELETLQAIRACFGRSHRDRKLTALRALSGAPLRGVRRLAAYHGLLQFLEAHPDDPALLDAVRAELDRVAEAAAGLDADAALDSGLPGTRVRGTFSLATARWLVERFGPDVEPAWDEAHDRVEEVLPLLAATVECDGLVSDRLGTRDWLRLAAGGTGRELSWLLERLARLPASPAVRDRIFDSLQLPILWRVDREAPRVLSPRPIAYQRGPLVRAATPQACWARPLPPPAHLSRSQAESLIDVARATLCRRQRETDPVTYADPRDVTLLRLEHGLDVALFGMTPERRQPLESYVGYLAARNRVPVAYGGAWIFGRRAEIGISVFDEFRGGASAPLFCQVLRVYRRHFGVRCFIVDPFQFGARNSDGIRSGAFWFYYRLGFRPTSPALAELAHREWQVLRNGGPARTPAVTLRRLTRGRLALPAEDVAASGPELEDVGLAVTRFIGDRFGGDRERAAAHARRRAARILRPSSRARWTAEERAGFDSLSVLAMMLPGVEGWPAPQRRALVRAMRAKGGPREREYVRLVQRHPALLEALGALAAQTAAAARR